MFVKMADCSGAFYPKQSTQLKDMLDSFKKNISKPISSSRIVISPHAGYIYSGLTAMDAYNNLQKDGIDTIVIMSPAHNFFIEDIALTSIEEFETPFGNLSVNQNITSNILKKFNFTSIINEAFESEHGFECHLPLIYYHFGNKIQIVPMIVGSTKETDISDLLEFLYQYEHIGIIISSDMSHFLSLDEQQIFDDETIDLVQNLNNQDIKDDAMCGIYAIKGLIEFAKKKHIKIINTHKSNSSIQSLNIQNVVGYASFTCI